MSAETKIRRQGYPASKKLRSAMGFHSSHHPFNCFYCGVSMTSVIRDLRQITIDHVVATSNDGENTDRNKVSCCLSCNRKKADLHVDEFLRNLGQEMFWAQRMHERHNARRATFKPLNANSRQWAHVIEEEMAQ